jgi:hypothetical protein
MIGLIEVPDGPQLVKAILSLLAGLPAAFIGVYRAWRHDRTGRRRDDSEKSRALNELIDRNELRRVHPFVLQRAFSGAFGFDLDDRMVRFALCRHDPIGLLADLKHTRPMLRLSPDGRALMPAAPRPEKVNFRRRARRTMVLGMTLYAIVLATGPLLPHSLDWLYGIMVIIAMAATSLMAMAAVVLLTAAELTTRLDERHPVWTPGARPGAFTGPSRGKQSQRRLRAAGAVYPDSARQSESVP